MKPRTKHIVLALFLACGRWASAQVVEQSDDNPGSLWPGKNYHSTLSDRTARRKGDIVTVVISESSTASFNASTTATKKDSNTIALSFPILAGILGGLSTSPTSSTSGTGATSQAGSFQAMVTCTVKKVLPNGNMVIEGQRWIKINKDYQNFKLTGTIRPDDIATDNTVRSEKVADAEIVADGKGQISDRQRRGILTRILDWLF